MGAILAGIIQGLGQHAADQTKIKNAAQDKANEEMAAAFDTMATQAGRSQEDQFRLHQMAYTARTKGAKAIPAAQLQYWQQQIAQGSQQQKQADNQKQQQQNQQNQQAQGVVAQGTGLTPPSPDNVQGPAGGMSQTPQVPTGLQGLAPPNPTNAAGAPPPAAVQNASAPPPSPSPAPDAQAGAPPPISGIPSPGFNTVGPANTPTDNWAWALPPKRRWYQSPIVDTGGAPLNLRSPEEQQEFAARGEALKYGAQYGAQSKAEIQRDLMKAVNERTLRAQDLQRLQPIIASLPEKPTMRDYARLEAEASTILGRPFTIPGVAALSRPQNLPGTRSGDTAPPGQLDVDGTPINPLAQYRIQRDNMTGEDLWRPTLAMTGKAVMPDPESPTKWSIFQIDRQGNVQGKTVGATPPAAYAPIVRNGVREQVVDFGDHKELIPITSQTTSQRTFPGAPTSTGGPPAALPSPNSAVPATSPPKVQAPGAIPAPLPPARGTGGRNIGVKALGPAQVLPMKNSIEVAAHQLWGDPDNPNLRPLSSYANLADDPGARQRIGQALKLVLDAGGDSGAEHLGASAGPVSFSAGNLGTALSYSLGIPQAAADAKAKALRGVFDQMKPEEVDYFNSLMNAIPTVTGFRKLTSGGAFRWSQQGLERELPMIGLSGVTSSSTFKKKMQALGDEPLTAIKNLERTNPGVVDPRLAVLIRGDQTIAAPGITPPTADVPHVTNEIEYNSLKPGPYIDPNGVRRIKR